MLWFSLIIPIILIAVLLILPHLRKQTKWWEIAIPVAATVLVVFICQWVAVSSAIRDKEYWGHMGYTIVLNEPFAYDSECAESYACGTDSKGNTQYCTRYVHCVKRSSRETYMVNDRGGRQHISYSKYKELDKRWSHNGYRTNIIITKSSGYTTIGDKHKRAGHGNRHMVRWDQKWETSEPIVKEYTYENRLQTQAHWGEVLEDDIIDYDLLRYPLVAGGWESTTILSNGPRFPKADKYLRYLNGHLNTDKGGYKKIRVWILVWNGQPQMAAEYQRQYWKGGNKNEFVVMMGLSPDKEVMWVDIMTHGEVDKLNIDVRDHVNLEIAEGKNGYSGKVTDAEMLKFAKWLGTELQAQYIKPSFEQYNYIDVQPGIFAIFISYFIILLVNIGAGFFVVYNGWHDDRSRRRW